MSAPTYESAQSDLDALSKAGVTPEAKVAALDAMSAAAANPQTVRELMDEIRVLSTTTIQMDRDFTTVYNALLQVDNSGFNFPEKLAPQWKRWTKLLWDSRNTATRTKVYLLEFDQVIMPMIEESLNDPGDYFKWDDAKAELNAYLQRPNPFRDMVNAGEPSAHSQAFTNLAQDIDRFKTKFDGFTAKAQQEVQAQIASVKAQMENMRIEIQRCDDMVRKLSILLGITLFATGVGAIASLVALGPLGPCVAIKILIVGALAAIAEKVALINYANRSRQLQVDLRAKEAELRALQDKLDQLKKIQALLEAQKSTISDIVARMDRFAVIWSAINHDCVELLALMESMKDPASRGASQIFFCFDFTLTNSVAQQGLRRRVNLLKNVYNPLMTGLDIYATQITTSGVAKP
ncbi:hypothetical protein RhiJN_08684 [Ceratobasidium sp. AG-Ba]|nr:hypothetical protein RhiJN_08684 [Ceratobasidium sp. AG-Ba]QRW09462.1 hypothetical protein RhiLY_08461 [Ceratobasidium sp. AG-Ba]